MNNKLKPQITTLEKSDFPGSDKTLLIRVFAPFSKIPLPQQENSKENLRKQIKELRTKMYKDGLIAEMNYEQSLHGAKVQEQFFLIERLTDSIEEYQIGAISTATHLKQISKAQDDYRGNLERIQEELDQEFLNELIQEQTRYRRH